MSTFSATPELTLPTSWDQESAMITDEELSATSHEEASKVFEQWQTDEDQEMDIMEVDEQIGSNLLGEEIFPNDPCVSPTGPLEELVYMSLGDMDADRFSLSLFNDAGDGPAACGNNGSDKTSSLSFEERYKATLEKLAESMKRSRETRDSLKMKTSRTEGYARASSVNGVLSSIEKSTEQIQTYLQSNAVERV